MLSSNMTASTCIATENNIHLCKHRFYIIVHNGFSMNFSIQGSSAWWPRACMVHWLSWISRSVCAIRRPCWRTAWRQWKRSIGLVQICELHVCACKIMAHSYIMQVVEHQNYEMTSKSYHKLVHLFWYGPKSLPLGLEGSEVVQGAV